MGEVSSIIRSFLGKRVIVIGDSMLDGYLEGTATRLSPEGPFPVVAVSSTTFLPGGAANAAVNIRSLGGEPVLISVTGRDLPASTLRQCLVAEDVSSDYLIEVSTRRTTVKSRVFADEHQLVRFDEEDTYPISEEVESGIIEILRREFPFCDGIVISDYLKGVLTARIVSELARLNREHSRIIVVDSKDIAGRRFRNISAITPNHMEAAKAVGLGGQGTGFDWAKIEESGRALLGMIRTRWVIVTAGSQGAFLFEKDQPTVHVKVRKVPNAQIIGAGDSFSSALALALAAGSDIRLAAELSVEAASIAVSKARTSTVRRRELLARFGAYRKGSSMPAVPLKHGRIKSDVEYDMPILDPGTSSGESFFARGE